MGLLDRLAPRRPDADAFEKAPAPTVDSVFATKALRKFLASLVASPSPVLIDLGPVAGANISFLGEELGCKIFVEDLFADLDRHVREGRFERFADFLKARFRQASASVDGILCWDFIDYLDKAAALALAGELTRILRREGALLGFFGTAQPREGGYSKYLIVNEVTLKRRPYPAARGRQAILLNRDIIRLFPGLRVSDSFLLQNNLREILFRKPG